MKFSLRHFLAVLLLCQYGDAFILPMNKANFLTSTTTIPHWKSPSPLYLSQKDENDQTNEAPKKRHRLSSLRKRIFSKLRKPLAFLTLASSAALFMSAPQKALASAPVMAMPKAEERDPARDAMDQHNKKMVQQAQEELKQFTLRARQIEAMEGPEARERFEKQYKEEQERLAQERLDNIEKLKRDLLEQGICPFTDMEGQRQIFLAEKGLDLAQVSGTPFYLEKIFEQRSPQKSYAYRKKANREIVKCMVEDMKNRDIDFVEYFSGHKEKIANILDLPAAQASELATKYRANLEEYGQIVPPKEGEMSAKEKMAQSGSKKEADKEETKHLKAEAKAKAAAEKAEAKAKAREEKEKAKAEATAAKAEAKAAKEAAKKEKEAAKAAAAAAAAASSGVVAGTVDVDVVEAVEELVDAEPDAAPQGEEITDAEVALKEKEAASLVPEKKASGVKILPVSGVILAVGGSGYAFKVMRDKAAADEAERQRQFKLLMGGLEESSARRPSPTALEEEDTSLSDTIFEEEKARQGDETTDIIDAPKKKKKRGIKSVFGKKKNEREIDINVLVSSDAKAPEFAKLLAKILTFGAPGRFPNVIALPGDMPMETFDVDSACDMLVKAQESAGISKEEAAEVFANVVNCMLIDIVDLASSSLKEKDSKVTVEAIGIVVDFMNHAASLYNSIAEGVVIIPVTYGGDLSKGKLEQMYSAYAASGMTNMANLDEDFGNRVSLLQDVFQINEKKAEGLMMKAMQKNMMEMLKSGEGMEGMDEMMKNMGLDGMGGMPGMGDGQDLSPEQLKQMLLTLKELKDSGSIPPSELEQVKKQFKEAFGSSIDDVMKDADKAQGEISSEEKELLDLMKSILDY